MGNIEPHARDGIPNPDQLVALVIFLSWGASIMFYNIERLLLIKSTNLLGTPEH